MLRPRTIIPSLRSVSNSGGRAAYLLHTTGLPMEKKKNQNQNIAAEGDTTAAGSSTATPNFKPEVNNMQRLLTDHSSGGWDKCWEQGLIPWDLGRTTPVILHLLQAGTLPKGRALVPGCGTGYDVVAMACPERFVVGLEISDKAIEKANQLFSNSPNSNHFAFVKAEFFNWNPSEKFDLIFDYTFFCAIEPNMRPEWAQRINDLLRPDGELITLIFPISDHVGGPPYKVSVSEYEELLHPMGFKAVLIADNELAVGPRKARNSVMISDSWKREAWKMEEIRNTIVAVIVKIDPFTLGN
ncbi:Probable thiol methyltransferase 2 [Linum grandiflorum]